MTSWALGLSQREANAPSRDIAKKMAEKYFMLPVSDPDYSQSLELTCEGRPELQAV